MKEVWKPIKEFEGKYEVSNFGKVRSIDRLVKGTNGKVQRRKGMTKTQKHDKDGYLVVNLYTPKGNRPKKVHRLVANAFIDNPNNKPEINHIDGNKENNHANNLEWTTRAENMKHFSISGLSRSGEKHVSSKLTNKEANEIRELYSNKVYNQIELSDIYNINNSQISRIINNKIYKNKELVESGR